MSETIGVNDPYEAVLADLRARRERIDQAIATIEAIRGDPSLIAGRKPDASPVTPTMEEVSGSPFLGMTIVDAVRKLLMQRRRDMGVIEIASALQEGGLILNSAQPPNTVGSVLTRRFNDYGDIVRVRRGTWGLREWHPHTSFRKRDDSPNDQIEDAEQ